MKPDATVSGNAIEYEKPELKGFDLPIDEEEQLNAQDEVVDKLLAKDEVDSCTQMCARRKNTEYGIPCGVDCPGYKPESTVDDSPPPPKGYGELKVGMEGKLNGVPVKIRKITRKDVILRPLNRAIRDEHGMMVSFEEGK